MKIIILLISLTTAFGAAGKKTAADLKEIKYRNEMKALNQYPNLLPEVVITAPSMAPEAATGTAAE
jgi:ABC-type iron transport system FetAB ATPase subunit